jgi:hypothetical protein
MAQERCRASVPAECRRHGSFHRKLKKFIKNDINEWYEPRQENQNRSIRKIRADRNEVIGIVANGDGKYQLQFVAEKPLSNGGTMQDRTSLTVEARSAERVPKAIADRIHDPATSEKAREQYEAILKNLEGKNIQTLIKRHEAQEQALTSNPHVDTRSWLLEPASVHTIHQYGKLIDGMDLKEEQKAIALNKSLVRNEGYADSGYSASNDYVEQVAELWNIHVNYKKALTKIK